MVLIYQNLILSRSPFQRDTVSLQSKYQTMLLLLSSTYLAISADLKCISYYHLGIWSVRQTSLFDLHTSWFIHSFIHSRIKNGFGPAMVIMINKSCMDTGLLSVGVADVHQMVTKYIHYFNDSKMHSFHHLSGLIL